MWNYPVELTPDGDGGFVVTFPDVPPAITQGDDREEALMRGQDALETALAMLIDGKLPLPHPSPASQPVSA